MHYYQFNIGDYAKHTRHLTNNEDLAYRRLLDLYYLNEEAPTSDIKKLARLINMRGCEEEIQNVLDDFFELNGESWVNSRVDKELLSYSGKAERARENGKKGGRPPQRQTASKKAEKKIDETQIMAYMPLTGDLTFELRKSQTDKWITLYPSVDLASEVNKMIGWLDANPTKKKTKTGIIRFMNTWLSKEQDRGGNVQPISQTDNSQFIDQTNEMFDRSQAAKQRIAQRSKL